MSPPTAAAVKVTIHNISTWALVDTGADFTMIRRGFCEGHPVLKNMTLRMTTRAAVGAGGGSLQIAGELRDLSLGINGVEFRCPTVTVVNNLVYDVILGRDFSCAHRTVVDDDAGVLKIGGMHIPLPPREHVRPRRARARLVSTATVPARSECVVSCRLERVDGSRNGEAGNLGIFEPTGAAEREGLLAPRVLVAADVDGNIPIILTNFGAEETRVLRGSDLGTFYDAEDDTACDYQLCSTSDDCGGTDDEEEGEGGNHPRGLPRAKRVQATELIDIDGSDFSIAGKNKLRSMIEEYTDIFSRHSGDIGETDLIEHHIDTGEAVPIRQRPRRVPVKVREQVEKQKAQMLKDGIIEESSSPWCSPVVLVRKKDGSFRFCVDLRAVNNVTRGCAHPLPRVDEALDTLAGATWFTTLDMATGYWQVPLSAGDREKTAFSTGKGLQQFKVMAMGLKNAGATFQRLMELMLAGLDAKRCLVYLDDIIIFSKTEEEHIVTLRDVFERIRAAKLKLKPQKCRLAKREVTFLGHRITQEGLLPDPNNIQKVLGWTRPTSEDEVKSFLGLCGYYSRFVPHYTELTKPLREAKVVGDHLIWSREAEEAFRRLKDALTSSPVLSLPTFGGTFVLYTDASDSAVGSVLTERRGDSEKVIAYDSKVLSKQQRRWPTYDKELWAIVHAVRRFNQYTVGAAFEVVTDHKPLAGVPKSINVERDGTGRRGRWAIELSSYQFRVIVRPGQDHGNADAMSRQGPTAGNVWREKREHASTAGTNGETERADVLEEYACEVGKSEKDSEQTEAEDIFSGRMNSAHTSEGGQAGCLSSETTEESALLKAQQKDDVIGLLRQACLDGEKDAPGRPLAEWEVLRDSWGQIEIERGLVGMKTKHGFRALVPKQMRPELLNLAHDHPTSGHLGRSRTTERVRQHFLWPGMYADIRRYCGSCNLCQRRHRPAPRRRAPMVTQMTSRPFQRIAVDITEMPVSANGNRYAIVIMDYFSKFVRVYPTKRQDAETVTTALLDWVYDMGVPDKIHSDQGGQFESELFQQMCRRLGIQKTRTTPYHPESDGMVERFMRTLKDMVAKYVDPQGMTWDVDIKAYTMAYNSSVHSVTGHSPFFLLHGFEPKTPLEAAVLPPESAVPIRSYLSERLRAIVDAYKVVTRKTQECAKKAATRHDEHTSGEAFASGDRVWIRDNRVSVGGKPKLGLYYKGPGTIVSRLGGDKGVVYRVRDDKGQEKVLHFNQLKPAVVWGGTPPGENHHRTSREPPREEDPGEAPLGGENPDKTNSQPERTVGNTESRTEVSDDDLATDLMLYYGTQPTEYITRSGRVSRPPVRFPQSSSQ